MINHNIFHIAFCVDKRYFRGMGATISSVMLHNPEHLFKFHIFVFSISLDEIRRLKTLENNNKISIQIHEIDLSLFHQFSKTICKSYYSTSTFIRLVIPTVLKKFTDKVLYLDSDLLCINSINDLSSISFENKIALVVSDTGWKSNKNKDRQDGRYSTLHLKHPYYFNAGVLYIDIPAWERNHISDATMQILREQGEKLKFYDQDALNIALNGKIKLIPIKWNYIYSIISDLKKGKCDMINSHHAIFIHFAGLIKPWNVWTGHQACNLFFKYHQCSPWYDVSLDKQPLTYKEMRIFSRFLIHKKNYVLGIYWYIMHLAALLKK